MSPSGPANAGWIDGRMGHPLRGRWASMIYRCTNPKDKAYPRYGGRGITVCDRWLTDFWAFVADMGPCPPGRSLDRVDNDGPYSPENCRWATVLEQNNNRRPRTLAAVCGNGHPWTEENTRIRHDGLRECRACHREQERRRKARQKSTPERNAA